MSSRSFAACSCAAGSSNRNTASAFPGGSGVSDGTTFTSASSTGGLLAFQPGARLKGALVGATSTMATSMGGLLAFQPDARRKGALVPGDLDGLPEKASAIDPFTNHSAILGALKIFWSSGTGAGM